MIELSKMSDQEILEKVNPIMDNLFSAQYQHPLTFQALLLKSTQG